MKPMKALFLPAVALLMGLTVEGAFACSCIPEANPFLKVAPKSVAVIRGKVLRHTGSGVGGTKREMDVELLENLIGETAKKVVTVSGDPGNLCRPYVTWFPVGTEWVFALDPAEKEASVLIPEPDKGDYSISKCGANWLEVKDGKVIGNIDIDDYERRHERQEVTLGELRRRLKAAEKSALPVPPASNNAIQPTANSVALKRKACR